MTLQLREVIAGVVFVLGGITFILGLFTIMAKEYQQTLRILATHSTRLSSKAITEEGTAPILDGMARLLDAIRRLIATAIGVGAFLCLLGLGMIVLAYWMLSAVL